MFYHFVAVWNENGLPFVESPDAAKYVRAGSIVVSVSDNGAGISKENQKFLFQEGRQFNANKLQGGKGSGLGLWITKGVVELHHGVISMASDGEGRGCVFTVEIPQMTLVSKPEDIEAIDTMTKVETNSVDEKSSRPVFKNVLVVDDSGLNRKMVCRLLRTSGYVCTEAENGQECVALLTLKTTGASNEEGFDVILMDFEMPVMDGPTACSEIRGMKMNIPIIGLTGNVLQEDRDLFMRSGADEVLTKPVTLEKIEEAFRRYQKNNELCIM